MKEQTKQISELEPIKIGLTDTQYFAFYFRRPFAYEMSEATAKYSDSADLTGAEKGQKEFELVKENLNMFVSRKPEIFEQKKDKFEKVGDVTLLEYFKEYTPENEQIILNAWFEFEKKQGLKRYF